MIRPVDGDSVNVCSGCGEIDCRGLLSCPTAAGSFAADEAAIGPRAPGVSLTEAQRNAMTPDQVVRAFMAGNARFVSGALRERDFLAEMKSSSAGQYPAAIVLRASIRVRRSK